MFGLTFDKLLIIAAIAVVMLGPTRLPTYAAKLGQLVRNLRSMADGARDRMREEMGPEFDDFDWQKLDPRQYDPRRIIRDALLDTEDEPVMSRPSDSAEAGETTVIGTAGVATSRALVQRLEPGEQPPFDAEAT